MFECCTQRDLLPRICLPTRSVSSPFTGDGLGATRPDAASLGERAAEIETGARKEHNAERSVGRLETSAPRALPRLVSRINRASARLLVFESPIDRRDYRLANKERPSSCHFVASHVAALSLNTADPSLLGRSRSIEGLRRINCRLAFLPSELSCP